MSEYLERLIAKYRLRGLLVDTNLLMLYFVGEFVPDQISKLRRTRKFGFADYALVKTFMERFEVKVTTPNILTEVSNLLGNDIPYGLRNSFFQQLQSSFGLLDEPYLTSKAGAASTSFAHFGLTDSVIAEIARGRYLVLTDDFPLANYLGSINADVINFNHLLSLSD